MRDISTHFLLAQQQQRLEDAINVDFQHLVQGSDAQNLS